MLFVENARKHYYVTNEIMKRWYLFDIVLLLVVYVFCCIKNSIFCCFYMDFIGLSKICCRQQILKEWLRNKKNEVFYIKLGDNNEISVLNTAL